MFGRNRSEVLIVGAGPVGLFTAVLLEQRGVTVEVIDSEIGTSGHSYAAALHPRTLHLLDDVGVVNDLLDSGLRIERLAVYDGTKRRAQMDFSSLPSEFPFALVVPQHRLEDILEERLRRLGRRVKWNHRLASLEPAGDRVKVLVEELGQDSVGYIVQRSGWVVEGEHRYEVPFVIGADGHHSRVRRALQIDQESIGAEETYAVFEFEAETVVPREVRVVLGPNTRDVLWPLPDGRWRWSFQIDPMSDVKLDDRRKSRISLERADADIADPLRELEAFIRERAPWFEAKVGAVQWANVVPFAQRLARTYGDGRCWLVGDAAHVTGPIGVHSMNVGLQEAHELAWRVAGVQRGHMGLNDLRTFDRRRRAEWRFLLGLEGGLAPNGVTDQWVAENASRLLPCIPSTGRELAQLVEQVGLVARGVGVELN